MDKITIVFDTFPTSKLKYTLTAIINTRRSDMQRIILYHYYKKRKPDLLNYLVVHMRTIRYSVKVNILSVSEKNFVNFNDKPKNSSFIRYDSV